MSILKMVQIIDLKFLNLPHAIASFLIPTKDGSILIETGPASTLPALFEGITKAGFQPHEIKHVFITHIHLDHAGAAWWFAEQGATIYLHPKGMKHMEDPSRLMSSARRIYQDQMDSLWGDMHSINPAKLKAAADKEIFYIGDKKIQAWHTPGHAVHHVAWSCDKILFTGDVAGVKIENGPVVPPCPPPDINLEDWINSINSINEMPVEELYLTHYGIVVNKESHLVQLKAILNDWAFWVKNKWEMGLEIQKMIPEFKEYVRQQLLNAGVNAEVIKQYEAANPSWMSVNGLVRYWEKKNNL
jgi:glyoxylase-like metal-dependent hydrolase (beta-lactamase superfamily II)